MAKQRSPAKCQRIFSARKRTENALEYVRFRWGDPPSDAALTTPGEPAVTGRMGTTTGLDMEPISNDHEPEQPSFGARQPPAWLAAVVRLTRRLPDNVLGRRAATLARSLGARMHGGAVDVEVLGARMRLHTRGNACEKRLLFTPHYFDPDDLEILEPMIGPGFVFIDVGANVGAYTLFVAARGGPDATVVAVEPHPVARERLAFNVGASGHAGIRIVPHALSDGEGAVRLKILSGNIGNTTIASAAGGRFEEGIEVATETLFGMARRLGLDRIDAIKMDIEGHEDVVLGAFFAMAPPSLWPQLLIVENNRAQWSRDLVAEVMERGYDVLRAGPGNAVLRRKAPVSV